MSTPGRGCVKTTEKQEFGSTGARPLDPFATSEKSLLGRSDGSFFFAAGVVASFHTASANSGLSTTRDRLHLRRPALTEPGPVLATYVPQQEALAQRCCEFLLRNLASIWPNYTGVDSDQPRMLVFVHDEYGRT